MLLVAQILSAFLLLVHIYIVLLETVFYGSRGVKVFRVAPEHVEVMRPSFSNQGCYNGFLVAALALGFFHPEPAIAHAFMMFGLACVAVAGVWGGLTVMRSILLIQTLPAVLALIAFRLA